MKILSLPSSLIILSLSATAFAQTTDVPVLLAQNTATPKTAAAKSPRSNSQAKLIQNGRKLIEAKQYKEAAPYFYNLVYGTTKLDSENKLLAKFYLGFALGKLKLNQLSSFNYLAVSLSTNTKLTQKAFEQLVLRAQSLNDVSLLNYSLKKTELGSLTEVGKEFYFNNLAKISLDAKDYQVAIDYTDKSLATNSENDESIYLKALSYIQWGKNQEALPLLEKLFKKYDTGSKLPSRKKDEATVALARVHYNLKNWEASAEYYKKIAKDSHLYRQVLMELSWAYLRNNQFRTALSYLHSLNTPYYENFYDPESLVLRSLILLFICQPEDLDRSINFFRKYYVTAYDALRIWNENNYKEDKHFQMVEKVIQALNKNRSLERTTTELPYFFFRTLIENPAIAAKLEYLNNVKREQKLFSQMYGNGSKTFLRFGQKILAQRQKNISLEIGRMVKSELRNLEIDLSDFVGQFDFIAYEALDMKRKTVQTPINPEEAAKESRKILVQNGFQYYPFEGEYWRDEIGNYQYIGKNQCQDEE